MSDLSGLSASIHQVNAREVQIAEFAGGLRRFAVEVPVVGSGDIVRQIWFPSSYVERPLHNWGIELNSNHSLDGVSPNANAVVISWDKELMEESRVTLYKGCRMKFSIRNPLSASGSTIQAYGQLQQEIANLAYSFTVFFEGRSITRPGKV